MTLSQHASSRSLGRPSWSCSKFFPERVRESDGVLNESGGVSAPDSRGLNRRCWDPGLAKAEVENGPLPSGRAVCAWYKSEGQSTCDVERLIGIVKRHIKFKQADVGTTLLRDCTTVDTFGPQRME